MTTEKPHPCLAFTPLVGVEWVVDAFHCDPGRLCDCARLRRLCEGLLHDLELTTIGSGLWHQFPMPGGVTGMYLLTESHLACHTYPEHQLATFNLYCCRPRPPWDWEHRLTEALAATWVRVRSLPRGGESEADR